MANGSLCSSGTGGEESMWTPAYGASKATAAATANQKKKVESESFTNGVQLRGAGPG